MCMHERMHTCRPTTTGRTKILAICATTAAMLRRMYVGGEGRQAGKTCLSARICARACVHVYEKRVLPLPRASLIHFHYIFAIGALRDILYLSFNRASHASRCNFAYSFFFYLFSSQLLSRLVSRSHLRIHAGLFSRWLTFQHPA